MGRFQSDRSFACQEWLTTIVLTGEDGDHGQDPKANYDYEEEVRAKDGTDFRTEKSRVSDSVGGLRRAVLRRWGWRLVDMELPDAGASLHSRRKPGKDCED